ncbi:MAG: SCO family protein [Anaerolineales bacterium]|nr:SCO family protein [Anaerolineales bacterium]
MDRKTLNVIALSLLAIGLLAGIVFMLAKPDMPRGTTFGVPFPPAADFTLTRENGEPFWLSAQRGNLVLLFFGYTSCPDVCPTTLAELNLALQKLKPDDAAQITVVFVTVDPERDTPERVQEYVNNFNASFIGLSGTEAELAQVWNGYGVFRQVVDNSSAAGYLVDHTARVTLIDRDGNMRISFPYDAPVEDIVHDLKLMLRD